MARLVAGRLVRLVLVLVAATLFTYAMIFVANSTDELVDTLLQINQGQEERRAEIEEELNLDDPLLVRYGKWLGDAATGDFGRSYANNIPVSELLSTRIPRTLALVVYTEILALALAVPAGIWAAYKANTAVDRGLSATSLGFLGIPNYVAATFLVLFLSLRLGWFPAVVSSDLSVWDLRSYFLPALSLALGQVAVYMRILRTDMIATLQEDFVGTAKAKGMPTRRFLFRHALRPSSLSLVTVVGITFGSLVGGTVIIERIFGMPGMGNLLVESIFRRDILVVQAVVLVVAAGFVIVNFLVDLTYAALDPRIRGA